MPSVSKSKKRFLEKLERKIVLAASLLAVGSIVAQYGFYLSSEQEAAVHAVDLVIVGLFLLDTILSFFSVVGLKRAFFRALPLLVIAVVFGLQLVLVRFVVSGKPSAVEAILRLFRVSSLTKFYFLVLQGYILATLLFHTQKLSRALARLHFKPAQILLGVFLLMIAVGTALLLLPRAAPPGKSVSVVDALFTSTSAVCVTGLVVLDTATDFSRTGQAIILFLMQIGGLGIMTLAAFFALVSGRGLSMRERVVLGEVMNVELMSQISRLVVSILAVTFFIELVGTVLFFNLLPHEGLSVLGRFFTALFHSVSGFCNAGFSTFSDSFAPFFSDLGINLVMMSLIVLGGLGFTVHQDLLRLFREKIQRRKRPAKLKLQTKVVLWASFLLIVLGSLGVYALSGGRVSLLQSLFQSVTARTAGFYTQTQDSLGEGSQLLTMVLMFIGAAPGSTGGGIKVSTLSIFLATVFGMLKGRRRTEMFRKTLPEETVRESVVVFGLSIFAVMVSFMVLLTFESAAFKTLLFETVSAFGTVGLSLGATAELSTVGKLAVAVTMLFGRIGPMTIALAVSRRTREKGYAYAMERIMVG